MRGCEWLRHYGLLILVLICMVIMADSVLCVRA